MRVFLFLVVVAFATAFFTKPGQGLHQGVATELIKEGKVGTVDASTRATAFGDFFFVTKSETWLNDKRMIQCWGAFTRFLCFGPPEADKAATGQA